MLEPASGAVMENEKYDSDDNPDESEENPDEPEENPDEPEENSGESDTKNNIDFDERYL